MGEVRLLLLGTKQCLWESHRATEFCDLEVRAEELLPPSSQLGCSRVDAFLLHPSACPTVCLCWHRSPGCLGSSLPDTHSTGASGVYTSIKKKKKKRQIFGVNRNPSLCSAFSTPVFLCPIRPTLIFIFAQHSYEMIERNSIFWPGPQWLCEGLLK